MEMENYKKITFWGTNFPIKVEFTRKPKEKNGVNNIYFSSQISYKCYQGERLEKTSNNDAANLTCYRFLNIPPNGAHLSIVPVPTEH